MELRQIRYFQSVARLRSFTRAAAELHIVQPGLSQQIKHLERELGIELLDRRNGHVTVTPAGARFLRRVDAILTQVNVASAEMRAYSEAETGRVSVGAEYTLGAGAIDLPGLFKGFSDIRPGVQIHYTEATTQALVARLRDGQCDVALIDLGLVSNPSDLSTDLVTDEELVVLVGPRHPLAQREFCRLEELATERFIRMAPAPATRQLKLVRAAESTGFTPNFAFHAGSVGLARALVSEGLGVHVTHAWLGEGAGPPLVKVRIEGAPLTCRMVIAQLKDAYHSPALQAFLSFASDTLHFRRQVASVLTG